RGRALRADGRRVLGDDPGDRLCRRGRGAVPLRGDDARHQLRRAAPGLPAVSAGRRPDRPRAADRAGAGARRLGAGADGHAGRHRSDPADRPGDQHPRPGRGALHEVHLPLPGRRPDPAGCHGWRHRADPAVAPRRAPSGDRRAGEPPPRRGGCRQESRTEAGNLTMTIGLGHYLTVAAILFTLGIFGIFLNRKNVIVILMSIELMLLAVNINLVAFSTHLNDLVGQVFTLFVLTVAAAEAAIGLAILVVYFRNRGTIAVENINLMKG